MPPIPKTIGRYEILELVGRGGMGVLYRARDAMLERDVALKMMLVDFTLDQSARERFEREAKAVARLQHRNVVTIHELGEHDGAPYIVMEFLSGQDLEALLSGDKPLSLAEKLDIASQLCEGLGYAHEQGIVHRDIKPGNVRVLEDGTVKILDFGIAKFAVGSATQSGTILGTASYMAPEQIMGQAVDGRADLFSAGVLLQELLTGKKPFSGDSPTAVVYQIMHVEPPPIRTIMPELPEALDEIVARALKKNPDERYSRASEMASDLQMVRMMLDLPLHPPDASQGGKTMSPQTVRLFATTIGTRPAMGAATAALETPMREAADTAGTLAAGTTASSKTPMIAGAAVVVAAIAIGGYFLMSGGSEPTADGTPSGPAGAPTAQGAGPNPGGSGAGGAAAGAGGTGAAAAADLLVVSSVPAGARIVLNGTDTGKVTPAAISTGGQVPSTVELTLKGYQPLAASITAADLQTGNKEFRLARESGPVRLTISGAFPFEVLQGTRVISPAATSHTVTVQPGGGVVSARSREYLLSAPINVDFQRSQLDLTLPAPGTLAVFSAVETCSVVVDGQELGFPPIPSKTIAAGQHVVALKCPDGKEETRKITVAAGQRVPVTFGPPRN